MVKPNNLKGKALKRAMSLDNHDRLTENIPLIVDTTEIITPEVAKKMLEKNKTNRPINWNKVEEYCRLMEEGKWRFHAQGIIFDDKGNLLTGQKRLWAIIYSGIPQHMRVSRGSPRDTENFIDRGVAQTARDLASRNTNRKHSPTEQSIARAMCALKGITKPSPDQISKVIIENSEKLKLIIESTRRIKKTKSLLMVLAAICSNYEDTIQTVNLTGSAELLSNQFERELFPAEVSKCWNRGAAFTLGMEKADELIRRTMGTKI